MSLTIKMDFGCNAYSKMRKLDPTHQFTKAPFMDVAAHQLSLDTPLPRWCSNLTPVGNTWTCQARDKEMVVARPGDWVVGDIEGVCMIILTDEEFKRLYIKL